MGDLYGYDSKFHDGYIFFWPANSDNADRLSHLLNEAGCIHVPFKAEGVLCYKAKTIDAIISHLEGVSLTIRKETKVLLSMDAKPELAEFIHICSLDEFMHLASSKWLKTLLAEERYFSLMQPIVFAETMQIHGHEFLIRGLDVDGSEISAPELLGAAEKSGLMEKIDCAAGLSAIGTAAHFNLVSKSFINIMPRSAVGVDENLTEWLNLIEELKIPLDTLVFEIVESEEVADQAELRKIIDTLKAKGIQIALDDFGSGFNNITTLMDLKPDYVKLDKALVQDIVGDAGQWNVVANLVDVATQVGVKVIAEGVENEETMKALMTIGVEYLQGYFFGMPSREPVFGFSI